MQASGYSSADVLALSDSDLVNSKTGSFNFNAGVGEFILLWIPVRLGIPRLFVGGFEGGFNNPVVVSVTNAGGFTEDYNGFRSANSGLGITTVDAVA